ncbi:uncharacterized protein A4U43_C09F3960 [Asparagus officinalis]|uniref:SHSP domain-containing protein n=1 Tax=Asparagus officinalis TaxID=4686 RepID=A0A5P1E8G1_ASPOF|nr:22.7 kDa class IV heat shock protein-like [Asparagus officinalis]ONK57775.1 uncharacterized protein A4U43_C09F3960 [Asparagus officinalis]
MKGPLVVTFALILALSLAFPAEGLIPYGRNLWDLMAPGDSIDPFRILEQTPLTVPKPVENIALARADWKETAEGHVISLDVPGVKREDIKIEVEDSRVLRVSGERKAEEESEGDRWHRAERTSGRFWRQFRMPASADVDGIRAHLENGVLRITVPKMAEVKRKQPRVVDIVEEKGKGGDIKASKSDA